MRLKSLLCVSALLLTAALTACQPDNTIIVMVVTATPTSEVVTTSEQPQTTPIPSPSLMPTQSAVPTLNPTLDPFPTPTAREIYVAEQVFQRGRMFWLQPTGQIWVIIETEPGFGIWQVYEDQFQEGGVEFDPNIVPPEGLYQPVRGFGLIWRGNPEVRDGMGWGTDTELGYVTNYEYEPAGEMVDGEYIAAPGYHFLRSLYGQWFRLNEINGTWQSITRDEVGRTPTP